MPLSAEEGFSLNDPITRLLAVCVGAPALLFTAMASEPRNRVRIGAVAPELPAMAPDLILCRGSTEWPRSGDLVEEEALRFGCFLNW